MATRKLARLGNPRTEFLRGVVQALWLPAWADAEEQRAGGMSLSGKAIEDVAPPAPREAHRSALRFLHALEDINGVTLETLLARAARADGVQEVDAEALGYGLAMPALGHGVSWTDDHARFGVVLPHVSAEAFRDRGRWNFQDHGSLKGDVGRLSRALRDPASRGASRLASRGASRRRRGGASRDPVQGDEHLLESFLHMLSGTNMLDIGDRQIVIRKEKAWGPRDKADIYINFYNLPKGVGGAGGGAEAENNRMSFYVRTTTSVGAYGRKALPPGKVKVEMATSALPREFNMRAKTGAPFEVAKYFATFLNKVVREVPPRFTHTRRDPASRGASRRDRARGFPVGAKVLVDGLYLGTVRAHFPQGSSSYLFPHYKVDMQGGDRNMVVGVVRVGVKKAARS